MNKVDDTELDEEINEDLSHLDPSDAAIYEINKTESEYN
jgi:hypothetical protein